MNLSTPLLASASAPTKNSFLSPPTIPLAYLGYPTIDGNIVLGPSSPLRPALQRQVPVSIIIWGFSSSSSSSILILFS